MAIFRIQVFKQITGSDREWSNTYLVNADDIDQAVLGVPSISSHEQDIHLDLVTITRALVSDIDPTTDLFVVIPLSLVGERPSTFGEYLPLFNTVRADISVAGSGRPSRKYYRLPLLETDQANGLLDVVVKGQVVSAINGMISDLVSPLPVLIDPDSQLWLSATAFPKVQMRQLHRKRRKTTPAP